MALHFTEDELAGRRAKACAAMAEAGLDGLLLFRQESMYYLSGYDTFGFVFFQCLVLTADGRMVLLTRAPDLRQGQHTSDIDDIRVWKDEAGANPAKDLVEILSEHECQGKKIGIEFDAYGLTAFNWRRLEAELQGFCEYSDASDVVSGLRVVKSPSEMEYVRRAAELADDALDAARDLVGAGAWWGRCLGSFRSAHAQ